MDKGGATQANVFRVNLTKDIVSLSLGVCNPSDFVGGKIPESSVQETDSIHFPISMLSGIVKQLIEVGAVYQETYGDIGFDLSDEADGVKTVRI